MRKLFRSFIRLLLFIGVVSGAFFVAREWRKNKYLYLKNRHGEEDKEAALNEARVHEEESVEDAVKQGAFLDVQDVNAAINPTKEPELSGRQHVVYAIIRGKKSIEMRDLLPRIPGVTERTLRRDLLKLQSLGLIEKHGTTKSSTYVLKR